MSIEAEIRSIVAEEVAAAMRAYRDEMSTKADEDLNFGQACKHLKMSEHTLRNLCRQKRIPHRTHGSPNSKRPIYSFSTRSLDEWKREEEAANYKEKEAK